MLKNIPIIKNLSPTQRAIAITVGLLLLYELLKNVPLIFLFPEISPENTKYENLISDRFNFFSLGIMPALTGFFLVEIFSFFLPPLKTWRMNGKKGRNQLTKLALIISLILAVLNTYWIIMAYRGILLPNGDRFWGNVSLLHEGLVGFVLVLGVVTLCGMAELITRHGFGNGFCVIIGYAVIASIPRSAYGLLTGEQDKTIPLELGRKNIMTGEPPNLVAILIFVFLIIVIYQKFWKKGPDLRARFSLPDAYKSLRPITLKAHANEKPVDFQLPYLPQGVFCLLWPYSIIAYPAQLIYMRWWSTTFLDSTTWPYLFLYTVLLVGTSYLGYWLISHPQRIAHNTLGKITFEVDWQHKVKLNAIRSIAIITLAWFLWNIPWVVSSGDFFLYALISIIDIIILAAILKDMISQYRFMRSAENPRALGTFDNVHFVTVLKGLFEAEGIRFCVQAFEYRRLFYFFEPLIKMRVLVDARDWDRANQLADLENVTII